MKEHEYRVVRFYFSFFADYAYKLQRKEKVLFGLIETWKTIEKDHLGVNGYKWARHFNCPIVDGESGEVIFSPEET